MLNRGLLMETNYVLSNQWGVQMEQKVGGVGQGVAEVNQIISGIGNSVWIGCSKDFNFVFGFLDLTR
jgi:hypothetical protein